VTICAATVTDAAVPLINRAAAAISGPSAAVDELGMLVARSESRLQPSWGSSPEFSRRTP